MMNRIFILLSIFLLGGCTTLPPSEMEEIARATMAAPAPVCEMGHDDALVNGTVSIHPGETICVELRVDGTAVTPVAIVTEASASTTLVLKFWLDLATNTYVLSLHNPLALSLDYQAWMLRPGEQGLETTTNCPVLSNRMGIEYWPHAIDELQLKDFHTQGESPTIACD